MDEHDPVTVDTYSPVSGDESQTREQLIELVQNESDTDGFEQRIVSTARSSVEEERISLRATVKLFIDHVFNELENPEDLAVALASAVETGSETRTTAPLALAASMCANRPESAKPLCKGLVHAVHDGGLAEKKYGLSGAAHVAQLYPDELTPITSDLDTLLRHSIGSIRREATRFTRELSESRPEALTHAVPELYRSLDFDGRDPRPSEERETIQTTHGDETETSPAMLGDKSLQSIEAMRKQEQKGFQSQIKIRENAAVSLSRIAEADPGAVADGIDSAIHVLETRGDPFVQGPLMELIRTVTEWQPNEYPSEEAIGVITTILADWDHSERRKQAALILAHVAERRPDLVVSAVESHTDRIDGLLTSDDPISRHAGATLLSHVAERNPESVATPVDPLVELLDDDHKIVRGSALWALRYIGTPETAATIRETATNDPDPEIRNLAEECARHLRQDGE